MCFSAHWFDRVFHAGAFGCDDDGLGVVHKVVEDGASDPGIVVEDFRPVFVSFVRGDDERAVFVALADDPEEEVGTDLVERQITKFVQ